MCLFSNFLLSRFLRSSKENLGIYWTIRNTKPSRIPFLHLVVEETPHKWLAGRSQPWYHMHINSLLVTVILCILQKFPTELAATTTRKGDGENFLFFGSKTLRRSHPSTMKICTHNGNFHCDEALAISILKLLPEFREAEVIRTRDQDVIDSCDVVVDVGSVYDPEKLRFDHHQTEFNDYFDDKHHTTRLSSAGLVYKHFSKRIFREIYGLDNEDEVEELYQFVYNNFVEAIDAIDNGVSISDSALRYKSYTDLTSRVGRLNPSWVDDHIDPDDRFEEAMKLTLNEFHYVVTNTIRVVLGAKEVFLNAYENRFKLHPSGLIIETPRGMLFMSYMHEMENRLSIPETERLCFYVTYEKATGQWRASCTRDSNVQFSCRMPFPPRLSGLRDEELQKASGIPNLTFIHRGGFTCGGTTKESVLKLLSLTIEESRGQ